MSGTKPKTTSQPTTGPLTEITTKADLLVFISQLRSAGVTSFSYGDMHIAINPPEPAQAHMGQMPVMTEVKEPTVYGGITTYTFEELLNG